MRICLNGCVMKNGNSIADFGRHEVIQRKKKKKHLLNDDDEDRDETEHRGKLWDEPTVHSAAVKGFLYDKIWKSLKNIFSNLFMLLLS